MNRDVSKRARYHYCQHYYEQPSEDRLRSDEEWHFRMLIISISLEPSPIANIIGGDLVLTAKTTRNAHLFVTRFPGCGIAGIEDVQSSSPIGDNYGYTQAGFASVWNGL